MKKLQQFYIMKLTSDMLEKFGYRLKRVRGSSGMNANDVRKNHELIALGDNQALRTIREVRYERNPNLPQYDPAELEKLYEEKRKLKKQQFTDEVKRQISIINGKIDDMLFMPEYVSVVINNVNHYKRIIKDGLYINGYRYVRLMCSAGQARVNTVILIREDFEAEVKRRLKCGAKEVKITKNKYNAYFALSSSSTYLIPKPNVLLINDCERTMEKDVDWIEKIPQDEKSPLSNNERVITTKKELEFNFFDGCGAVSVEFAQRVAAELDIDYIPSAFCVRCAYVKGMVFVIDFKKFAQENNIQYVNDLYGNSQKIEDIDIILTKSQFKLYNAYDSIEDYDRLCEENHFLWGVTKLTPKYDDNFFRSNYQFCQAIDLRKEEDVEELCQPTVDWLNGVANNDVNYTLLYLLGKLCDNPDTDFSNIMNLTSDNIAKALLLNPDMINEEYIKSTITYSINKKIRESYLGKLILNGNFSVMIPDMYAFMQHAFGMEVTGALKEFEHYSNFWNKRGKKDVVAMRSPLTWRSEVNKLNLVNNELTDKWFTYLTSGIVYNVWGCDCMIHADSDFDGDIVASTDNEVFLRCRYDNLPITYSKSTVEKEFIKEEELYQADIQSFNSTIGQITNISTSFYELLSKFEDHPEYEREQAEILERLKLIRKSQGDSIDKAKGIKIEPMPKHWTRYTSELPKGETDERMKFCNSIVADRKPYFFRYLYPICNSDYAKYQDDLDTDARTYLKIKLSDLLKKDKEELTAKEKEFLDDYYEYSPLIDYNGRMNKICHFMERSLKFTKNVSRTSSELLQQMMFDSETQFRDEDIDLMNKYFKRYRIEKSKKAKGDHFREKSLKKYDVYDDGVLQETIVANSFDQYCSKLKREIIQSVDGDMNYIVDLAIYCCYIKTVSKPKSFVWDLFGNQIVKNIMDKSAGTISVPFLDEEGNLEYLGKRYSLMEVKIK